MRPKARRLLRILSPSGALRRSLQVVGALDCYYCEMISRRNLLQLSGLAAVSSAIPSWAQDLPAPDYRLEIAPVTLDLSPRHRLKTLAYNGHIPGPLLRLKEGTSSHH